jgi:AcrR family transcriptional regulator
VGNRALETSESEGDQTPALARKLSPGPGMAAKDVAAHQLTRIHKATIDLVANHGYEALKVRDVVRQAEVSTRAFYEHFSSKEDCFLRTYELISRRASCRIIAAQVEEPDWRKRPRLIFEAFAGELELDPDSARFALIEAYAAGDVGLEQAWRAERLFEGMLAEAFARTPDGISVPPLIVEGMVAGIAAISRGRLREGRVEDLRELGDDLVAWALCYPHELAVELSSLDRQTVWRDTSLEPLAPSSVNGHGEPWPSTGDRALILAAAAELAAKGGYASLTVPRIRSAAGISRRKFGAYFEDVEDCYLAALEQHAGEALAQAARAQGAGRTWPGGVYRAISALCDHVAGDEFLARVCLADDFPAGLHGERARRRLTSTVLELLSNGAEVGQRGPSLPAETTIGAVWSLFHHHVVRDWSLRRRIAATLSYMALAPVVGPTLALRAIRDEQSQQCF